MRRLRLAFGGDVSGGIWLLLAAVTAASRSPVLPAIFGGTVDAALSGSGAGEGDEFRRSSHGIDDATLPFLGASWSDWAAQLRGASMRAAPYGHARLSESGRRQSELLTA
jgi:hypothetical protein